MLKRQYRARDNEHLTRWYDDRSVAISDAVILMREGEGDGTVEERTVSEHVLCEPATREAQARVAEMTPEPPAPSPPPLVLAHRGA